MVLFGHHLDLGGDQLVGEPRVGLEGELDVEFLAFGILATAAEGAVDRLIAQHDLLHVSFGELLGELVVGELVPRRLADLQGVEQQDDHHEDDHPEEQCAQRCVHPTILSPDSFFAAASEAP